MRKLKVWKSVGVIRGWGDMAENRHPGVQTVFSITISLPAAWKEQTVHPTSLWKSSLTGSIKWCLSLLYHLCVTLFIGFSPVRATLACSPFLHHPMLVLSQGHFTGCAICFEWLLRFDHYELLQFSFSLATQYTGAISLPSTKSCCLFYALSSLISDFFLYSVFLSDTI